MSNPNPVRVAAGVPDGGRFAPTGRAELEVSLGTPGGLTADQRASLRSQRSTLRREADEAQARVDAIEMQLLADDLATAHPDATHVYVNRLHDGTDQVELYGEYGHVEVLGSVRPGQPITQDDDLTGRLAYLAERNGSTFHKMLRASEEGGQGVPIADLANADKARMEQEGARLLAAEKVHEQVVGEVVLRAVPDAVSWNVGTELYENGYYYTPSELWAKTADGREELVDTWELPGPDGEEARELLENSLAELSQSDGPLGDRTSHEADIKKPRATR